MIEDLSYPAYDLVVIGQMCLTVLATVDPLAIQVYVIGKAHLIVWDDGPSFRCVCRADITLELTHHAPEFLDTIGKRFAGLRSVQSELTQAVYQAENKKEF